MDTVYVETTVIGNIAGRLHPDPVVAARQRVTRRWWMTAGSHYRLFISQLTVDECSAGDPDAASERLDVIRDLPLLDESAVAERLAGLLIEQHAVPAGQPRDALHIATAAVHGVQFIVTWNFKHILNPHLQTRIADTCRHGGFEPPVICTPEQLKETEDDPGSD
jgi:predicted nucleic acid-binding protein